MLLNIYAFFTSFLSSPSNKTHKVLFIWYLLNPIKVFCFNNCLCHSFTLCSPQFQFREALASFSLRVNLPPNGGLTLLSVFVGRRQYIQTALRSTHGRYEKPGQNSSVL